MKDAPLYSVDRSAAHQAVRARDGDACWICGRPVPRRAAPDDPDMATLDHIQERSRGGPDELHNLALAHARCNWLRSRTAFELLLLHVEAVGDRLVAFAGEAAP